MSCKSRGALGCSVVYLGEPQQPVFINCLVIDQSTDTDPNYQREIEPCWVRSPGQQRGVVQGVQVESIRGGAAVTQPQAKPSWGPLADPAVGAEDHTCFTCHCDCAV
ncbi:unnamed protein product [Boreogadus saida]